LPLRKIMGRQTLPANDLVRQYAEAYGDPSAQFDFVYFLDGREKDGKAIVSDEAAFRESQRRTKWDIALD
ncbi:MAG: protein tyrosine phosphatase, partial [Planctomycetota bacterium]|nr:protein tyrosine phosphatase [Planctomycetota bacterium]